MAKRILEDIRINKNKKEISFHEKVVFSGRQNIEKEKIINKPIDTKVNEKEFYVDKYIAEKKNERQRLYSTPQLIKKKRIINKYIFICFFLCVILGGIYWAGNIFEKTEIIINSKSNIINFDNKTFISSKDKSISDIDFEIMITSDKKLKSIILTEPKELSEKSSGSITIYNEFSINPQKLVAGTFIVDESGKTYKIDNTITVPGYKVDSNKKIMPGKIEAKISSFLAGEIYNGSPDNFYITSFKGTAKYNKIYGKLKDELTGGISGIVYVLKADDIDKLKEFTELSVKSELYNKVKALVPPGYILYPEAQSFSYNIDENVFSKTPEAEVNIEGTLSVVLLKENDLVKNIINISLPEIKGSELNEINITNLNKLVFNFIDKNELVTKDMSYINFSFTGDIKIIWNPDILALKNKLLGIHKNSAPLIFQSDPGISSAILNIFPPWKNYITKDINRINVIIK